MTITLTFVGLFLAALIVGYFSGIHATRPIEADAVALKRLLDEHERATLNCFREGTPEHVAALKEARAHLAWWRTHA